MKNDRSKLLALLATTASLLLTACGGGNDDEAGAGPLALSSDNVSFKDGTANCTAGGPVGTITIFGGAAPYRIFNDNPDWIFINKSSVGDRGGNFTITALGFGCLSPGIVTVQDNLNNRVVLEVTLEGT
jgi:hypothetical protein